MPLVIDGATPAIAVQSTGSVATCATASFTPPDGAVLLIRYSANTIDPVDPGNPTITDNLGVHLTYTSIDIGKRPDTPAADGQVATWTAVVASSAAMTITVTNGAASPNRHAALAVTVLTGADTSTPVGAHGKTSSATNIAAIAQNFTGTRAGSQGFLVVADWFDAGAESAGTGCTLEGSADVAANYTYAFIKRTTADGTSGGTTTLNATLPGNSSNIRWAWVEILPALSADNNQGTGLVRMPPWLLLGLLMRRAADITALLAAQITAESGSSVAVASTTATATKIAVQTGRCAAAGTGSATAVKRAPAGGVAGGVATTRGLAATGRSTIGRTVVAGRVAGSAVKVAPTSGSTVGVAVGTAGGVKRAVEVGTTLAVPVATGSQTSGTARAVTGTCSAVGRAAGAAAKVAPAAGTSRAVARTAGSEVKIVLARGTSVALALSSGVEGVNDLRSVIGRCSAAGRASGLGVKRAAEQGLTAGAARAVALGVKRQAQAGRATAIGTGSSLAARRIGQTGRTIALGYAFGSQAFVPARIPLGDRLEEILNTLISFTMRLGLFDQVMGHEPKSPPRNGLTAALWLQTMAPAVGQSSISSTSLRVAWYLRIYQNFLSQPEDAIDPIVMRAMAAIMEALSADFDLDLDGVRAIDLLGITGPPMGAEAGYVPMGQPPKIYRCMTLTIPIIVDDVFAQSA